MDSFELIFIHFFVNKKRTGIIGLSKSEYQLNSFLITRQKHMLWYSLEAPHRGASNEYPQHKFLSRNNKNIDIFWRKKAPYHELRWIMLLTVFDLITAHTPISAVKKFRSLQITASVLFLYFFIKAYVVGTHLNYIDLSMQFK